MHTLPSFLPTYPLPTTFSSNPPNNNLPTPLLQLPPDALLSRQHLPRRAGAALQEAPIDAQIRPREALEQVAAQRRLGPLEQAGAVAVDAAPQARERRPVVVRERPQHAVYLRVSHAVPAAQGVGFCQVGAAARRVQD